MTDFERAFSNDFAPVAWQAWREQVEATGRRVVASLRTELEPGVDVEPLYAADNATPEMTIASQRPGWTIGQQYDLRDPEAVAAAITEDRGLGLQSAWVRLDPALRGAAAPRGRIRPGVRIASADDATVLLAAATGEATSSWIHIWIEAGAAGPVIADAVDKAAKAAGIDRAALSGGVLCDPLAALAENGCLADDLAHVLDGLSTVTDWAEREDSTLATVGVSAVPYHDAGASVSQELAACIATGIAYLRALEQAGRSPADALPRFLLRFAVDGDLFVETAKLRAARWLWTKVGQQCGVDNPPVRIAVRTGWRNRTRQDPWGNLLRGTVETMAAVFGGADDIATQPLSEVIGVPTAAHRRWAIDTQHLLKEESHLGHVVDAAAGSWCVETLGRKLAEQAWELVHRIETTGGMSEALLLGEVQEWIAESNETRRLDTLTGRTPLVGATLFPDPDERRLELPAVEGCEQLDRGAQLEAPPLPIARLAEPFEALMRARDAYVARTGAAPRAVAVTLGPPAEHREPLARGRALLHAGGFHVETVEADDAADAIERTKARIVMLCAGPEQTAAHGPSLVRKLVRAGATTVVVASFEGASQEPLRQAGVSSFVPPNVEIPPFVAQLQRSVGVEP